MHPLQSPQISPLKLWDLSLSFLSPLLLMQPMLEASQLRSPIVPAGQSLGLEGRSLKPALDCELFHQLSLSYLQNGEKKTCPVCLTGCDQD